MKNKKRLLNVILILSFILSIFSSCKNINNDVIELTDIKAETIKSIETTSEPTEKIIYPELKIEVTRDETRIYEHMEYVFILDDEVLGEWEYFAFCRNYENFQKVDFENEIISSQTDGSYEKMTFEEFVNYYTKNPDDFDLKKLKIFNDGIAILNFKSVSLQTRIWTNGYILLDIPYKDIVPAYTIKNIGGTNYMFLEWKDFYINSGDIDPGYIVFRKTSNTAVFDIQDIPDDMRNLNLSFANLSKMGNGFRYRIFNDKTIFPAEMNKMPTTDNYQPNYILEAGKNPGLGVRSIHEQGITGKGVNVAIIDEPFYMITGHPEYKDKIVEYVNMTDNNRTSHHGALVTSLLAGKTIGTAPGVNVYFYSPQFILTDDNKFDALPYATALDMVVEKNKMLPNDQKIKIVNISVAPTPLISGDNEGRPGWANGEKYLESYNRAIESGLLVLDASLENGIIGACEYDFENPEDVTLCNLVDSGWGKKEILAPMMYRTIAEALTDDGVYSYTYQPYGGLSSAIPYAAGIVALGWEVRPDLTADEIMQILLNTAYVGKDGNKYIYPNAFIDYLKNN